MPRKAFSRTIDAAEDGANMDMDQDDDHGGSDNETGDGTSDDGEAAEEAAVGASQDSLPESVTKCSSRLSSKQRMANLNADRQAL